MINCSRERPVCRCLARVPKEHRVMATPPRMQKKCVRTPVFIGQNVNPHGSHTGTAPVTPTDEQTPAQHRTAQGMQKEEGRMQNPGVHARRLVRFSAILHSAFCIPSLVECY